VQTCRLDVLRDPDRSAPITGTRVPQLAAAMLVIAAVFKGGCGTDNREDLCPEMPKWESSDLEVFPCDVVPELCGLPIDSVVREPDLDLAIDVVFLGDGYTGTSIASYRDRVCELVGQLSADSDSIVGRDPTLFNFHRVDVIGPGPQADSLAAANAPAADVVVEIVAPSGEVRANVSGGDPYVIKMSHSDSHRVLTHEMGHALIGLHDEYVEFDSRHYFADMYVQWTSNPLSPNLSLSPGEDWGGLVSGAIEGGGRHAYGVYRPTNRCRMLDDSVVDVEFCPVCSAAIDLILTSRRGATDGPPRCGIAMGVKKEDGFQPLLYFGRDGNGLSSFTLGDTLEIEIDIAALRAVGSRLPTWFDLGSSTTGSGEIRMRCTDGLGEMGEAALMRP